MSADPSLPSEPNHYLFNVSYTVKVAPNPNPQNRSELVLDQTLDAALLKFRTKQPDAEVTQVQRQGTVTV